MSDEGRVEASSGLFERPWNIAAYTLTLILLVLGPVLRTNLTALLAVLLFLGWDVAYTRSSTASRGRTIEGALQQTQNIREHISYFLAFYGVLFAILFTQSSERQTEFLEACRLAGISMNLLAMPFVLSLIPLLFFPIQLMRGHGGSISRSLKALVAMSAFLQKVSIFLFAHSILRVLDALTRAKA